MTDLNEKLKLVAEYDELQKDNYGKFFKNHVFMAYNESEFMYHKLYDWQIPVWQKVLKEIESHNLEYMSTEWQRFGELWTLYHDAIDKSTPLESFEILVQAIQFINKMEK